MNFEGKFDILVVDDEEQIRRLVRLTLEGAGFFVREAETGRVALGEITLKSPDLVILDLGLPDAHGTEVLKALRKFSTTYVIVLTVVGSEESKIAALDSGADDYMTKPFSGGELVARLKAILRRTHQSASNKSVFLFGPIELDFERSRVLKNGKPIKLTVTEFKLLRLLVLNRDKVLTHASILSSIWGPRSMHQTNYLRIYIMRLRRKLGEDVDSAGYFQTESGVGYRFVSDPSPLAIG
jgi:two-component system KDP operon response regulator KdpE